MGKNVFITVVGFKNYFGNSAFKEKETVLLRKEPDNIYDKEAIAVEVEGYGVCGYVSNSPLTTLRGTKRASRIYDTFDSLCEAEVVYSSFENVVCALKIPFMDIQKNILKGKNVSLYLEKIEDEKYAFSILYDDNSETKVLLTIKDDEKTAIKNNLYSETDFELIISEKLKLECFFKQNILLRFSLIGNIIAFAEVISVKAEEIKSFFDI